MTLAERVDELERSTESLQLRVDVGADITSKIVSLNQQFVDVTRQIFQRLDSMEQRVGSMEQRVGSMEQRVGSMEQSARANHAALVHAIQENHSNVMTELGRIATGGALN